MKISIFLIIGFTNFVFCCDQTYINGSYADCPVNLFRRKRNLAEYTRWRANIEPTPEFIVKVLDDDFPAPKPKKVVAVNIQPATKSVDKIIVGGAMVTMALTSGSPVPGMATDIKDYTRFVPPTTVASHVEGDLFLAPVTAVPPRGRPDIYVPNAPKARNPQRDESPPASPQFLPHQQQTSVRQYAPIAPVAFGHKSQIPPLTPPDMPVTVKDNLLRKAIKEIFRSSTFEDIILPTRTKPDKDELDRLNSFDDDQQITRTSHPARDPERTDKLFHDTTKSTSNMDFDFVQPTEKFDFYTEKKNYEKDADTDDIIFYNYDDENSKSIKYLPDSDGDKFKHELTKKVDIQEDSEITTFRPKIQETTSMEYNEIPEEPITYKMTGRVPPTPSSATTKNNFKPQTLKNALRTRRREICSMVKLRDLNFNSPRTLPEIEAKLKQWAEESPVAKWVDITDGNLTAMERPIYMMIVDDPSSGQVITAKQTVVIVAGIQGRDQHAVAAAMYVLYQLIERTDQHSDLLTKFRFWIIPVLNPDGYDYAMTFPHRREWTKNLRQNWDVCKGRSACHECESFGLRCTIQPCYGVNLDRNFEYQWIPTEELNLEHPCGALYAGKRQLSEVETSAFVSYLHAQNRPIYLFIAFKEGEVLGVMYPYSHTRKKRAYEQIYKQRASRAAAAAYSISGRPYLAGQTSQFLPLYAGGIEDWVDGHLGVDNTFTIMMFRPADTFNSKLITERVVHEAYAAMDTLVLQSIEEPAAEVPPVTIVRAKGSAYFTRISHTLLLFTALLHIRFT